MTREYAQGMARWKVEKGGGLGRYPGGGKWERNGEKGKGWRRRFVVEENEK